jgi:hypothetical protein
MQNVRSRVQENTLKGVDDTVLHQFMTQVLARKARAQMPPDAKWYIVHPHSRAALSWAVFMRILGAYYFFIVPFNIAFLAIDRVGALVNFCHGH